MTIKEWLNSSRDFGVGVALYRLHGSDDFLMEVFEQGFSEVRAKRLLAEMLKLKDVVPEDDFYDKKESLVEMKTVEVAVESEFMPETSVRVENDRYRGDWMPLYQKMNMLRHRLEMTGCDVERGRMAHEILDLERNCMEIWDKRDYFLKYGEVKKELKVIDPITDRNMILKRILNLRVNISKYKNHVAKDKPNPKHVEKLAIFRMELEDLLKQIEND